MTRKLVTVRVVKDIVPIVGADKIELVIIDGWQVVVLKEHHHRVGELVLYYEIDSFLPDSDPRYATFEERFTNWGDKRGMRLKTIKLRKQLSQGLVMSLDEFPEVKEAIIDARQNFHGYSLDADDDPARGLDVTELLKIEKWEPIEKSFKGSQPGSSEGKRFPAFIRKTDQERIQNFGALVDRAIADGEPFEVTMKKDGSSMTVFRVDPSSPYWADAWALYRTKLGLWGKFIEWAHRLIEGKKAVYGICSRNVLLTLNGDSNFHKATEKYDLLHKLALVGGSYALQGEVVAPDIQDNHEKVTDVEFHLFDIYDIDKQAYLLPGERSRWDSGIGLPHVTTLALGDLPSILPMSKFDGDVVKAALDYAEGPGDNPGVQREGVVFKSLNRDFSFKAVSNSYLLKTGK